MSDPFDYRCHRCGEPLMSDGVCERGEACRTPIELVRHCVAWACSRLLAAAKRLGLVE